MLKRKLRLCFVFILLVFLLIILQFDCALADETYFQKLWGDEHDAGVGTIVPSSAYSRGIVLNLAAASYTFDLPVNRDYMSLETESMDLVGMILLRQE